jgi:hypothetical protein
MKSVLLAPVLCFSVLVTSCSKDATDKADEGTVAIVSNWESVSGWTSKDSIGFRTYSYGQPVPELTDALLRRGVVLVWAKGLPVTSVFGLNEPNGPRSMPFTFFPVYRQLKWVQDWSFSPEPGRLGIRYTTNEEDVVNGDGSPSSTIRLRYFVVPPALMARLQLTPKDIRQMDYARLVQLCGTVE